MNLELALTAARDRAEVGEARVWGDRQESEIVRLLGAWLVQRASVGGGTFTADDAGDYLDTIGLPRTGKDAMNLRKRLVATTITQGKREGRWYHDGYHVSRRHGGPRTVWRVGA